MAKAEPAARPSPADAAMADTFARRGDAMLAIKDISAARKFYEFAANAGNAHAAVALARTYDPAFTTELGIIGLEPDPKAASVWYRKAAELNGSAPASVDPAAQVPPNAVKREAVR
jgi:TPR repeat protein